MQYDGGSPDIPMEAPPFEGPAPIVPYKPINSKFDYQQPIQDSIVPFYQPVITTMSPIEVPQSFEEAFSPTYIAPNEDSFEPFSIPPAMFEKEYVSFPTMEGNFGETVKFYL